MKIWLDFDTPDEVYVRRVVEHVKEDIASGNILEPPEIGGIPKGKMSL